MEADDQLEDHDEHEDRYAHVHVEGLPADSDLLGVLRLLADAKRRLVDVALELVEETLRRRAVSAGQTRVLVFVNNEEDKNEECMEVTVSYA